jgi:hypothetical protein
MEQIELHPALEAEIKFLSEKVEQKIEGSDAEKKDVWPEIIRGRVEELTISKGTEKASQILPEYSSSVPAETKFFVEQIVDKLWHNGDLAGAVSEAKKGGPLALDLFHDVLSGTLQEVLKARGIL